MKQNNQAVNDQFKAFVIGGTGGVGAHLVEKLCASPRYAQVTVVSRRELAPVPKLNNIVWQDFTDYLIHHPEKAIAVFEGHDVGFCCLGASEQAMMGLLINPNKFAKDFHTVDYDYVVATASAAHQAGVPYFSVTSSTSANPEAKFIYSRIKGEMERDVQAVGFTSLSIFQPSHLVKEATGNETMLKRIWKSMLASLTWLIPSQEETLRVEDVAEAMKVEFEQAISQQRDKVAFYEPSKILALATSIHNLKVG